MTRIAPANRGRGHTLIEVIVATAIYAALFAALAGGAIALQRSFAATERYSRSVSSQLRILDYVTRDVRRASAVNVTQNARRLNLTLPDQYSETVPSRKFRIPEVSMTKVTYGANPASVAYYINGSNCIREENGVARIIATDVADFQLTFDHSDPSGNVVATTVTFPPKYQSSESAAARNGTTLTSRAVLRKKS